MRFFKGRIENHGYIPIIKKFKVKVGNSKASGPVLLTKCAYHIWIGVFLIIFSSCTKGFKNNLEENPSPPKTPEEELSSFEISPGLNIELVAAEPLVQDPVVISFDEDGNLWVVEMRGFMPDIDGNGERSPVGRVSILQDTNSDGRMDVGKIYLDSLIMPRALAIVKNGALIVEQESLWLTQDLNNDLQADTKILIDPDYAGSKFPEHSGNGLWRGIDNWYYNVKSRFRYRLVDGKWLRDSTEFRGQWGISHDDKGRLYYNYNWSQLHADLVPPNYFSRNKNHRPTTGIDHGLTIDRRVYPIRPNPAVNRGYIPGTLDKGGHLLEFTAASSPLYYRGTALPEEFYGNVFVCEPSGNLIKRNLVEEKGFLIAARDPHPGKEFLASTDERFRPVYLASGPDGALYVADMYRGLIQHGAYVTPYLREQTLSRKLVQPVNYGRIWRIVPDDWKLPGPSRLSDASSEHLIDLLSSQNGWHRDMAQRLLVERNDKRTIKQLTDLADHGDHSLGRFHALWTLEGLKEVRPELLFKILTDQNSLVSTTALRLLEPVAKTDKKIQTKLENELLKSWRQASAEKILQMTLTAGALGQKASHQLLKEIITQYDSSALIRDAVMSSLHDQEFAFLQDIVKSSQWKIQQPAKEIFLEMLTTSVIKKRNPSELKDLLSMVDVHKDSFGWQEKTILTAISIQGSNSKMKPVWLESPPEILTRTDLNIERSVLDALASLFEWPGHVVHDDEQKKNLLNEKEQQQFALGRQHYLTTCSACHNSDGTGLSRFAPPLIGSDWVLGDEKRLALIILHGMEGPVEVAGKIYDEPEILPVMPAHSTLDDASISNILTYIRNEWGNHAGPVSARVVGKTRHTSQGRVVPWTAAELNEYVKSKNDTEE